MGDYVFPNWWREVSIEKYDSGEDCMIFSDEAGHDSGEIKVDFDVALKFLKNEMTLSEVIKKLRI